MVTTTWIKSADREPLHAVSMVQDVTLLKEIVASGYSDSPVLSDFRRHGFVGALEKPFGLATRERTLREIG